MKKEDKDKGKKAWSTPTVKELELTGTEGAELGGGADSPPVYIS
jgi:hypothetical protein